MTDKPTPTDAEILDAAEDFRSHYTHGGTTFDEFDEIGFARAVLAKWGQPALATQQAGESVYAFRRKGLDDFCTCDEARYEELSNKPHLFETRVFYTAPQPSHGQAPAGAGMGHTDGGRNMFYEGRFDGESQREQQARLRWANDMRAAFERHTGNGWFDKDWRTETGLWSSAWHACLAAQPTPPAQAADSVQKDAARYRWLREGNDAKHGAAWHVAVNLYGCEWDAAIDAAIKKGASHDR